MTTGRPTPNVLPRRVRFTEEQRLELVSKSIGLTEIQLFWLERALPLVAYDLSALPRSNDVRDEIRSLLGRLKAAEAQLLKMGKSGNLAMRSHRREALGHLTLAAAKLDRTEALADLDDTDDAVPERVNVAVLVRLAVAACELALDSELPKRQRLRRSGEDAIKRICQAIEKPLDEESLTASNQLRPSRAAGHAFPRLCEVVFEAAIGSNLAVENAIREFMKKAAGTKVDR